MERFIIDEGHTAQTMEKDYGYDLLLFTCDEQGYSEPEFTSLQVKAAELLHAVGSDYVFDISIRDYNFWMLEQMPVILILFDAGRRRAFWVCIQSDFHQAAGHRPKKGMKKVRVRVPKRRYVNRRAIAIMRELKWAARRRATGQES